LASAFGVTIRKHINALNQQSQSAISTRLTQTIQVKSDIRFKRKDKQQETRTEKIKNEKE